MSDRTSEDMAGLAAAIVSIAQHAEVIEAMAKNLKAQAADASRRLAALTADKRRG